MRNIAAGFIGIITAGLLVWLVETIGHSVYPVPADLDFRDAEAVTAYVATLPMGALAFVAAAWFIGTLGGVLVACKIGASKPIVYAVVVGGFILLATAFNLATIPHPIAFSVIAIAGIIASAWLGSVIGASMTDRETA